MRVYATEDSGIKHLVALECDICETRIKPNPKISESGWIKLVKLNRDYPDISNWEEWHLCPQHA